MSFESGKEYFVGLAFYNDSLIVTIQNSPFVYGD